MKLQVPWAKRKHSHSDPTLLRDSVCSGCGHLILTGQVRNKLVHVSDRAKGLEYNEVYGESCAPGYDLKEIAIDGAVRFYKNGNEVEL